MVDTAGSNRRPLLLATAPARRSDKRLAFGIAMMAVVVFAAAIPYVRVPLLQMPAFIPTYEAALVLIDLITAIVLFDQVIRLGSLALMMLAAGYLFDAFIIVPHALTFPGAFAPRGLLGAGEQTTAWLYVFWHGGFPLFVLAYSALRRREPVGEPLTARGMARAVTAVVAGVLALVIVLTMLATRWHDALPVVMRGSDYSLLVSKGVSPAVWLLTLVAMLTLWRRDQNVIDLWLMLVMWVWLFDIALAAVFGSARYDLGFYAGRVFGLLAASFLLVMLLVEVARLYTGLTDAVGRSLQQAELTRARDAAGPGSHDAPVELFTVRLNIARYTDMLSKDGIDATQRRAVERLLSEEQAKLGEAATKSDRTTDTSR